MLTSRLAVRDHLSGAQIEISCIAIDITILMSPQRTVDVAPAGFEPATHGLGNRAQGDWCQSVDPGFLLESRKESHAVTVRGKECCQQNGNKRTTRAPRLD